MRSVHGARFGKIMTGALLGLITLGGAGWSKREVIREQYYWRVSMRPSVLTTESEMGKSIMPGSVFRDCQIGCPAMIVLPPGEFIMGDQSERHRVTIAKPFAVAQFDVTFDEWDRCTAAGACPQAFDAGWGRGDRPVINISWNDAKSYVAWLSRLTGKDYHLLSEAQFEYAAHAGTATGYPWGEKISKGNANCIGCGSEWDGKQTATVGSFTPNGFGLLDMHGNVWTWCEDSWHNDYEGAPTDGSAWTRVDKKNRRVVRGGSWTSSAQSLRSAYRGQFGTDDRSNDVGLRVARTLGS